jgi:hypothetical protein
MVYGEEELSTERKNCLRRARIVYGEQEVSTERTGLTHLSLRLVQRDLEFVTLAPRSCQGGTALVVLLLKGFYLRLQAARLSLAL